MRLLQEQFDVPERRACRVLGQQRSTQRQPPKKATEEEGRLVARMLELVRKHPRFGYRRIWALLRREGWRVSRETVRRWLHRGQLVWRRPRPTLGPKDPERAAILRRLRRLLGPPGCPAKPRNGARRDAPRGTAGSARERS